ncbi:hypothetical protein MKZ38_006901 [Zalerion maritima]|uniref:Uncharacterized protein n=1 Tax=Zalerion maritima TaxID=339359 RepID=A0AAD5RIN7_9PEZI|nr:hypothetical protein MKZ38_006901 [Zalerion maritima]
MVGKGSDADWWETMKSHKAELERLKSERDKFKAERDKLQKDSAEQRAYFDGLNNRLSTLEDNNKSLTKKDIEQRKRIDEQAIEIKELRAENSRLTEQNESRTRKMQQILEGGALPPSPKSTGSRVSEDSMSGANPAANTTTPKPSTTSTAVHRSKSKSRKKDDDRERVKERERERERESRERDSREREDRRREKERERERADRAERADRERRADEQRELVAAKEERKKKKLMDKIRAEQEQENRLRGRFEARTSDDDQNSNGSSDRRNKRHSNQPGSTYVEPWGPVSPPVGHQYDEVAYSAQTPAQYGTVAHSGHASHTSPLYAPPSAGYGAYAPPMTTAGAGIASPQYSAATEYVEPRYRESRRR